MHLIPLTPTDSIGGAWPIILKPCWNSTSVFTTRRRAGLISNHCAGRKARVVRAVLNPKSGP